MLLKNLLALTSVTVLLSLTLTPRSAEALAYGGSATGAAATVPATGTTIRAATGTMSISGGTADSWILVGDIPGSATGGVVALSAGVMHSAIVGLDATRAEASTGNVTLTVSGNQITTDFLMARSTASCGPAVTGSSELDNLVINGQVIVVTGSPNQTVALPNGTAIINEQMPSIVGTSAELTVNALHVTTTDPVTQQRLADVVLASVDAKIDCQAGSPPNAGSGTGGGWLLGNGLDARATFGVVGAVQSDGSQTGHVVYNDHSTTSFTFTSTTIGTVVNDAVNCQTTITGTGEANGTPGATFSVTIKDNAQPGAGYDMFTIKVPSDTGAIYTNASTTIGGGNIKEHASTCP